MVRSGLFDKDENAVALLGVEIRAEVVAGHACAVVRQRYRNDEAKAIEAVYTFPLPTKAMLTGFSMTTAGGRFDGEVREREEAFRHYDDAITAGHGGALLEQERPNVFTANVGNLLPGEETAIEIQYVEPVLADEGAVRWTVPTLVAPRYIPGTPSGDRSAHGTAEPTSRVPDADRISPPISSGAAHYGLTLDLTFDLGTALHVASPSHPIVVEHEGEKTRVRLGQASVALDRDVVVTAWARSAASGLLPLVTTGAHRKAGGTGTFALTLVPDLGSGQAKRNASNEIVFLLDRSGSMGGASMPEARTALRLCLRQLREGDRFAILAFDDSVEAFMPGMAPYTEATLQRADAWLATVDARGGTELLAPMLEAAKLAPDGLVVLLTDGEVGNEDEILSAFLSARRRARVCSFGIGTNVSDALLAALADRTGGAVEMIHPGERLDEKVIAQFARATAPRVTDVKIEARGIELGEIAPADARSLVDAEPYCLFATYEAAGRGAIEVRGKLDGQDFRLDVPVELPEASDRPIIAQLWAQARIRDLEHSVLTGRKAEAMKARIVKLAIEHGVSSRYTSFVVVEKRAGERRATGQPETRVVPVMAPAGWDQAAPRPAPAFGIVFDMSAPSHGSPSPAPAASAPMPRSRAAVPSFGGAPPPPARAYATRSSGAPPGRPSAKGAPSASLGAGDDDDDRTMAPVRSFALGEAQDPFGESFEAASSGDGLAGHRLASPTPSGRDRGRTSEDPILALLSKQSASGLWEEPGRDVVRASVDALVGLLRLGLSTAHPVHGAQLKKAVDALLASLSTRSDVDARLLELALGVVWLLASGRRTRHGVEAAARGSSGLADLASALGDEAAVRARVESLTATL